MKVQTTVEETVPNVLIKMLCEANIVVPHIGGGEIDKFSKNLSATSKFYARQGWHEQVSYWEPTNIRHHYFVLWPTNAQLFHKLSHSYMFRHYRIILREFLIYTLPSYTSISNAAVGNTIYN